MTDVAALADRLYADAVAAPLRAREMFLEHRLALTSAEVEEHCIARGAVYSDCIHAPIELIQQALREAHFRWITDAIGHAQKRDPTHAAQLRAVGAIYRVGRSLLLDAGRETVLSVDSAEPAREIVRWRFVSLALPSVILTAARASQFGRPSSAVRLLHRSMAPDGAVAHQHLHHAAMLSFEEVWASLRLRALLEPGDFRRRLRHKLAWCPGLHFGTCLRTQNDGRKQAKTHQVESAKHMEEWGDLLFNAFIARGLLDRHAGHGDTLKDCDHPACREGYATLRAFIKGRGKPYSLTGTSYPWPNDRLLLGRLYWDSHAEGVFKETQEQRRTFMREQTEAERSILARAFQYVRPEAEESHDDQFEILLLQYLRVKTALHGLLVHPTGEHGLEKFLEHFSQIKVYEPRSDRLRPGKPDEPGLNVGATEYRVAPDAWLRELGRGEIDHRGRQRSIEDIPKGEKAGEAAWLIHFKRAKHDDKFQPLHGLSMRETEAEARKIGNALEQNPRRLRKLRGIDICGVEEQQPLWVCAEILRKLRRRSAEIAAGRPGLKLEPLRLTLHAGEDFRWLTSGVRAVAEPFQWKLIERGDRIGHGIAVTLEPESWWEGHRGDESILRKRIDRLQDLAFLAAYTDPHPLRIQERSAEEQDWLACEIADVIGELGFRAGPPTAGDSVGEAKAFWTVIGGRAGRRLLDRAKVPDHDAPPHEHWLYSYFWNSRIQDRAEAKMPVRADETTHHERDLLTKARLRLVRELARWQIPIESNPSSNLVVASLDAMASQDFLAQSPHKKRKAGHETLPWTISTDDPITFATSLADEYAYAWAGMVLREKDPFDPAHARALLEEAAATSMRTRFTLPDPDVA